MRDTDVFARINSLLSSGENLLVGLGTVFIFLMSILITAGVISRVLTGSSISGIPTFVTIYFMIGIIFLTGPYLQRSEAHVRVDLLYGEMSDSWKTMINLGHRVLMIAVFVWFAYLTYLEAHQRWVSDAVIHGVYTFPTAYSWAMIPLGLGLVCLRLAFQVRSDLLDLFTATRGEDGD